MSLSGKRIGFLGGMLFAATVFFGAAGTLPFSAKAENGTSGNYELNFENIASNQITGISYDVSLSSFSGGWFFTNDEATDDVICFEAKAQSATFESKDCFFGLMRLPSIAFERFPYLQILTTKKGALYSRGDRDDSSVFVSGKNTEVIYTPGQGPLVRIDGKDAVVGKTPSSGNRVSGFENTWQTVDLNKDCGYFGFGTNGDSYMNVSLTGVRCYDSAGLDLGLHFSPNMDVKSVRYGKAGKTITVTPVDLGEKYAPDGLTAVDDAGQIIEINEQKNADGSFSFTMPSKNITISPDYNFCGHEIEADGTIQLKSENVRGILSFGYGDSGYVINDIPTEKTITMKYTTEYLRNELGEALGGQVRVNEIRNDQYVYVGNYWQAAQGRVLNEAGKETKIVYDPVAHAFQTTIGGLSVSLNDGPECAGPAAALDGTGAARMGICWSGGRYYASLTDFSLTDSDGWELGVKLSSLSLKERAYMYKQFAEQNKIVTFRLKKEGSFKYLNCTDKNGEKIDLEITDNHDGSYSFVMPDTDVRLSAVYYQSHENYNGSYYNESTKEIFSIGEECFLLRKGNKTALTIKLDSLGVLSVSSIDGAFEDGEISVGKIEFDGKTYLLLKSYLVEFDTGYGGTKIASQRLNDGNYFVLRPDDPTREDYRFVGWETADGTSFDFDAPVNRSIRLIARWQYTGETEKGKGCSGNFSETVSAMAAMIAVAIAAALIRKKDYGKKEK